jgi:hypothetical protein
VALVSFCALPAVSHAESPWASERFTLELGTFLSDFDTTVALRGPNDGRELDLEDELGLDSDQTTFRGRAIWRVRPRHRVRLDYYAFDRSARATADRSFVLETEDQRLEFDAGAVVATEFDWQLVPLTYAYSFVQSERTELAGSVGVHWAKARVAFGGRATINGQTVGAASESESTSAPLPVVGLDGSYRITDRWRAVGHAQYLGLEYGDFEGRLLDVRVGTEYRFFDRLGLGLAYTWYDIDLTVSEGPFEFELEYGYSGLETFLSYTF